MGLRINTNIEALNAARNLNLTSQSFQQSIQRLSSGLRINSAADDPAGNSLVNTLTAQVNGAQQAQRNTQDGISLVQVASGALNETAASLQRMRELAVQASNDTLTNSDRANIQAEVNNLISEVDRISSQTEFNNKHLLDGSLGAVANGGGPDIQQASAQAGVAAAGTYAISITQAASRGGQEGASTALASTFTQTSTITIQSSRGTANFTATAGETVETFMNQVNNSSINVTALIDSNAKLAIASNDAGTASAASLVIQSATGDFGSASGLKLGFNTLVGAAPNVAFDSKNNLLGTVQDAKVSISVNGGAAVAITATGQNSDQINGSGAVTGVTFTLNNPAGLTVGSSDTLNVIQGQGLHLQIGANSSEGLNLVVDNINSTSLGVNTLNLGTQASAQAAISQLDSAITNLSQHQATIGTFQNRLTNALNNEALLQQNLQSSRSQIQDTNIAQETVNYTRDQILLQAGTSVLSQANQNPTGLLALLR